MNSVRTVLPVTSSTPLREIEIAAGLQHPNILPLFDSGGAAAVLCHVMPFVDGESLRDLMTRGGALPIGDAMRLPSTTWCWSRNFRIARDGAKAFIVGDVARLGSGYATTARYHGVRTEYAEEEAAWTALTAVRNSETNYADMLMECGRVAEAEVMARRALRCRKAVGPDADPPVTAQVASVRDRLATLTGDAGRR